MVADEPYFPLQATPLKMARLTAGYYPKFSHDVFMRLLDLFGLSPDMRIEGFSKGMARQCAIALGLSSGARALLLDESFDGLDLAKRRLVKRLLSAYAKKRQAAVMCTSHNLAEVEDIADDIGMIDAQSLVFSSSVSELRQANKGASLEEIFLLRGGGDSVDVEAVFD
jgi:ABC-2 type transport system ATP-binding protein